MQEICSICGKTFEVKKFKGMQYSPKVCSAECLKKYLLMNKKYNSMDEMRGRIKGVEIFYNITTGDFRSKIEMDVAKFFIDNNIDYEFEEAALMYRKRMYLPDFYLPQYSVFVEIKDSVWEAYAYTKFKTFEKRVPLILITRQLLTAWHKKGKV